MYRIPVLIFLVMLTCSGASAQHRFVRALHMWSGDESIPYNAKRAYRLTDGTLIFAVDPSAAFVRIDVPGAGFEYIDVTDIARRAALVWVGVFGHDLPIAMGNTGTPNSLIIRTVIAPPDPEEPPFDNDEWARTYPPNVDGLPEVAPQILFVRNRTMLETDLAFLKGLFGTNTRRETLERWLYTIMVHEFGHAFGLAHPVGDFAGETTDMDLPYDDHNQLMVDGQLIYLWGLAERAGGGTIQESDIRPSRGEAETVVNLVRNCFPNPESRMIAKDSQQCYPMRQGPGVHTAAANAVPRTYLLLRTP